jgi:hypothetical protein
VTHRERLVRGQVRSEHIVHFFDDDAARARTVSSYITDALDRNQRILVVARPRLWSAVDTRLKREHVYVAGDPRLVVLDAYVALSGLMRHGSFDQDGFRRTVAPLVKGLAATPAGLCAYGEMVDILASEDNLAGACALERAWNELAAESSFTLLCGYAAAHFATTTEPRGAIVEICAAHSQVRTDASDALGHWLVGGANGPTQPF